MPSKHVMVPLPDGTAAGMTSDLVMFMHEFGGNSFIQQPSGAVLRVVHGCLSGVADELSLQEFVANDGSKLYVNFKHAVIVSNEDGGMTLRSPNGMTLHLGPNEVELQQGLRAAATRLPK